MYILKGQTGAYRGLRKNIVDGYEYYYICSEYSWQSGVDARTLAALIKRK